MNLNDPHAALLVSILCMFAPLVIFLIAVLWTEPK